MDFLRPPQIELKLSLSQLWIFNFFQLISTSNTEYNATNNGDRLLARGKDLASQQLNDWQWFKKEWDAAMAATHGKEWGSKFAGMAQHILQHLESGNSSAVAEFMHNETLRVLNTVPALRV